MSQAQLLQTVSYSHIVPPRSGYVVGMLCRMDATFAAISICMSCVWLNLVASEVVALLQNFGMILNAPTVHYYLPPVCGLMPCTQATSCTDLQQIAANCVIAAACSPALHMTLCCVLFL